MLYSTNNIISAFLVNSRFRIVRHMLLLISIAILTLNFVWYMPDGNYGGYLNKSGGWAIYMLLFTITIYINIYILVPLLLFKNRLFLYILSVLFIAFINITLLISVHEFIFEPNSNNNNNESMLIVGILSFSSSFIAFAFFFLGITAFLLFKNWIIYNRRIDELESTTLDSELKLLKSQINPHFLFNMLNNANIMVNEDPEVASQILLKLDDLLKYQINDSTKDKVRLKDDIIFLTDFLDLEKTRRDHFEYKIDIKNDLDNIEVPPLLFIPFVENAVKHNSDSLNLSYINISFETTDDQLFFSCENSKPVKPVKKETGGLGLTNIKRRLDLLYGQNYTLQLNETETTYTVQLEFKL